MTCRIARAFAALAFLGTVIAIGGCRGARLRPAGSPGPMGPVAVSASPAPAAPAPAAKSPAVKPVAPAAPVAAAPRRVGDFDAQDVPLDRALAEAKRLHRPCAILFVTSWCGWCRKLERLTLPDAAVRAELANWYVVRYDADSSVGRAAAARYGVGGFPTVELIDSTGRVAGEAAGFSEPDRFVGKLRAARR